DADEAVEVGAAEIGVEEDDALAERREEDGDVGGDERLAGAALAATDGDDAARGADEAGIAELARGVVEAHAELLLARGPFGARLQAAAAPARVNLWRRAPPPRSSITGSTLCPGPAARQLLAQPRHRRAPGLGQREARDARMALQDGMHDPAQRPGPLAVDDAHLGEALLGREPDVVLDQRLD